MRFVDTQQAPKPVGPYSQAIIAGNIVWVSGQIAIDPVTGKFSLTQTLEEETRQALKNVRAILEAAGTNMANIVKATVYLRDIYGAQEVNKIWEEFFPYHPKPAREMVAVAGLPQSAKIEISVIAQLPSSLPPSSRVPSRNK